jgi:hypothetical protein
VYNSSCIIRFRTSPTECICTLKETSTAAKPSVVKTPAAVRVPAGHIINEPSRGQDHGVSIENFDHWWLEFRGVAGSASGGFVHSSLLSSSRSIGYEIICLEFKVARDGTDWTWRMVGG